MVFLTDMEINPKFTIKLKMASCRQTSDLVNTLKKNKL